ncbi:MAG: hypothetical protein JRE23_16455 [Deltaproteobacteria bacterium]|nr:hypothetical protein [Deltaproteobacteria bacterium]
MATLNLRDDEGFVALLMAERAAMLARVDAIEKFLCMPKTKDLRKAVKKAANESDMTIAAFIGGSNE